MNRIQKIKTWCKDNPDHAVAIAAVTFVSALAAVAITAEVKEEKKQNAWVKDQQAAGRRALCLSDGTLVAVNPDYITY